jgi:diketogulonate reductase-like aldo/keto reductase
METIDEQPHVTLHNGVDLPALGFGVFQLPPEQTVDAVAAAISDGYRLIDTAAAYLNERQVGEALARSGVDRDDIFITTKLWVSDYGYQSTLDAFETSVRKLGLDHVDLYLLHQPVPSDIDAVVASYQAAEKLLADGRVRAIGVSNHTPAQLRRLNERTNVVPAVNQVELHPYFVQRQLRQVHEDLGIVTQAWSPLGGVKRYYGPDDPDETQDPLQHPTVVQLADKYGKTRRRSCSAGTSSTGSRLSRSLRGRSASLRTSTSSTSL